MTVKNFPCSPLPWAIRKDGADTHIDSSSKLASVACDTQYYPWIETADMPYIVHAANAYPKLVALVKEYADEYGHGAFGALLNELGEDSA